MLSNRCVICLSIGIVLLGLIYNHCSFECLLTGLTYLPFIGKAVSHFKRPIVSPPSAGETKDDIKLGLPTTAPPPSSHDDNSKRVRKDGLFTSDELAPYNGEKGLYLSILGTVYDVQKGSKFYDKGRTYHGFTGRDASRSFVTGDFTPEGLRDDVLDLKKRDLLEIEKWKNVYEKEYTLVGKLIGRYYDENGEPTEYLKDVLKALDEAHNADQAKEDRKKIFPPCNSEWIQDVGGKVWCSDTSGGTQRDWAGVPRRLYEPETGKTRCACVRPDMLDDPNLREFPDCPKDSDTCKTS